MIEQILLAIWIFLPAGAANASPVFANKIPFYNQWKTPIDFGNSYKGKRIFGDNKTWRGLVFGTGIAAIVALLQYFLFGNLYPLPSAIFAGFLGAFMGFGALVADAVESFFKRQRGIKSGESWFPFDQIDYIIGGLLIIIPFAGLAPVEYLWIFGTYFALHLITSYLGFLTGLKDKPI